MPMEFAIEVVKLATALVGLVTVVASLLSEARGRVSRGEKKKGRRR